MLPAGELRLAKQDIHPVFPSPKNPALQKQAPTSTLPASERESAKHRLQAVAPFVFWYVSAGQSAQAEALAASAYVPALHNEHGCRDGTWHDC